MAMTVDARKLVLAGKSTRSNSEAQSRPVWDSAADFTLPRKTSKENKGNRTPNRHR